MIKNREKLLTYLAIGVIGLLAADRLILTPLARTWKDRSQRISDLTKAASRGSLLLDREAVIRQRWDDMKEKALAANQSQAGSEVMKAVARWQEKSGISTTSVTPQSRQGDDYTTLEYSVDASGSMEAVTQFLYGLHGDPLPLRVESLDLSSRDDEGQELSLRLRFSALILSSENNER